MHRTNSAVARTPRDAREISCKREKEVVAKKKKTTKMEDGGSAGPQTKGRGLGSPGGEY